MSSLLNSGAVIGRGIGVAALLFLSWKVFARGLAPAPAGFFIQILDGANFIFHEAGHVFFGPFGDFTGALGGSLMQLLIPAACTVYFRFSRQPVSSGWTLFWTGESLTNVAIYVADARRMELPLIGGDHDWNYLLDRMDLLHRADALGRLAYAAGLLTILSGLAFLIADLVRAAKDSAEG